MATIGQGVLAGPAYPFFDALRSYDAAGAVKFLSEDCTMASPWSGNLTGREAISAFLEKWLKDAVKRPSFTLADVTGDGALVHFQVSVSGRFGMNPKSCTLSLLCLTGQIRQVRFQ